MTTSAIDVVWPSSQGNPPHWMELGSHCDMKCLVPQEQESMSSGLSGSWARTPLPERLSTRSDHSVSRAGETLCKLCFSICLSSWLQLVKGQLLKQNVSLEIDIHGSTQKLLSSSAKSGVQTSPPSEQSPSAWQISKRKVFHERENITDKCSNSYSSHTVGLALVKLARVSRHAIIRKLVAVSQS